MKTRDELLIAQAAEDIGLSYREHTDACDRLAQRALELERSGWQPPADPDLAEAREMLAQDYEKSGDHVYAAQVRAGAEDNTGYIKYVLRAIKRGREMERGGK